MRILLVGGVPARLASGPVEWGGHVFEMIPHAFDRFVRFELFKPGDKATVDQAGLENFLEATRGFDAILCETPEALILACEWKRRGEAPSALIALVVHGLKRTRAMIEWYREQGGSDVWPEVAGLPWISWCAASSQQQEVLHEYGIPAGRTYFIQGNSALYSWFVPGVDTLLDGGLDTDGRAAAGLPQDTVVVPGSGRRDPGTALRAAKQLPGLPFVIVDEEAEVRKAELAERELLDLPNVTWLDPMPIESYIALIKRATLVVVPLQPGPGDGGHTTVAIAHRTRRAVVCSRVPGIMDYVEDGANAKLVEAANPGRLAEAIEYLWSDPDERDRLGLNGHRAELKRCAVARENFEKAVSEAYAGLLQESRKGEV